MAICLTECIKKGTFPESWKRAKVTLIPKGEMKPGIQSKVRPICLLNDIGKIFETIIVSRMTRWMEENARARLSDRQFGFRKGMSTLDAVRKVRSLIEDDTNQGKLVMAIAIDIENAFNTIPWRQIREGLRLKRFPIYLRKIVENYLSNRYIECRNLEGEVVTRRVTGGVPQRSVLGPLLWNIAYDRVLKTTLNEGAEIIGYADDTIVLVTARSMDTLKIRANRQIKEVITYIGKMGLKVAEEKTEVIIFGGKRVEVGGAEMVKVGTTEVRSKEHLKYLGIILDSRWTFRKHLEYAADKAGKITGALGRIMPNLRGPSEKKRKLFYGAVTAAALYGSPIWSRDFAADKRKQKGMERIQRNLAIRLIAAYKTTSFNAATLLARVPPWTLVSDTSRRTYNKIKELREQGNWTKDGEERVKSAERDIMMGKWKVQMESEHSEGARTRNAILPNFELWMNRGHGSLDFHTTQILTGHGCFGSYLCKIGKVDSARCKQCREGEDTPEHTLAECTTWTEERRILTDKIGEDLALEAVVRMACQTEEKWQAFADYANKVLRRKEEEERTEGGTPLSRDGAERDG